MSKRDYHRWHEVTMFGNLLLARRRAVALSSRFSRFVIFVTLRDFVFQKTAHLLQYLRHYVALTAPNRAILAAIC